MKAQKFPWSVIAIFGNEACERFSFYAISAVFTIYTVNILNETEDRSIVISQAFGFLNMFLPIFGSLLADGLIGKFHTILWLSILHAVGNILITVAATFHIGSSVHPLKKIPVSYAHTRKASFSTPFLHFFEPMLSKRINDNDKYLDLVGVFIVAIGAGGIKPSVSPFGGDQFEKGQEHMIEVFYTLFYFVINIGALLSTICSPMIRVTPCLGQDTCYAGVFGMSATFMILACVTFAVASPWFKKYPPQGSYLMEILKCYSIGLRNYFSRSDRTWEDCMKEECTQNSPNSSQTPRRIMSKKCHSDKLVSDCRAVLRLARFFIPMIFFWALFAQQGSTWVLQAMHMNGDLGDFLVLPDQIGVVGIILLLLFLPIFSTVIYPLCRKCGIQPTPLRRMSVGGFLAATSFILAFFLQLAVQTKKLVNLPLSASSQNWTVQPQNSSFSQNPVVISLKPSPGSYFVSFGSYGIHQGALRLQKSTAGDGLATVGLSFNQSNFPGYAGQLFLCRSNKDRTCHPQDYHGFAIFEPSTQTAKSSTPYWKDVKPGKWSVFCPNQTLVDQRVHSKSTFRPSDGMLDTGVNFNVAGMGSIQLIDLFPAPPPNNNQSQIEKNQLEVAPANSISILWQIPQYVMIECGEVLFIVTGLEFTYSQAPRSMKSLINAGWSLSGAFGNLIVIFVVIGGWGTLAFELLLWGCLLYVVMIGFALIAYYWYEYHDYIGTEEEEEEDDDVEEDRKENQNEDEIQMEKY